MSDPSALMAAKATELNLGSPHSDSPVPQQTPAPRNEGFWQRFERGWVYWSPATGAQAVWGAIFAKYGELRWEQGFLGFPLTDELPDHSGRGRFNDFEGGTICWTAETGAHEIHGRIRDKWAELHGTGGFLKYPVTDELGTPDGRGRFNHFEGGSIYWTPETDAHEVHGAIRDKWQSLNWERGALRYPISDEFQDGAFRRSNFQHGFIRWTAAHGAEASISLEGDVVGKPVDE
jgi:uncharacterized protein with LGFP repeats